MSTPCRGCGGTGEYWDKGKRDWGNVDCPECSGIGVQGANPIVERELDIDFDEMGERFA